MPKEADIQLVRAKNSGCTLGYEVIRQGLRGCLTSDFWNRLEHIPSFAFYGESGNFTARRETRDRGGSYWVAYKKNNQHLHKAYLGRSGELTLEKLEIAALKLAQQFDAPTLPDSALITGGTQIDASPASPHPAPARPGQTPQR